MGSSIAPATGLVLLLLALSGCTVPGAGGDGCDTDNAAVAFGSTTTFFTPAWNVEAFSLRIEGTIEGDVGTMDIRYDAGREALSMDAFGELFVVVGDQYAVQNEEEAYTSRDFDPSAGAAAIFKDMMAKDDAPAFLDDAEFGDYTVTCETLGGVEVYKFSFEADGASEDILIERAAPYRIFSGRTVDPALQDNFRASISYDTPTIRLPNLDRAPIYAQMRLLDFDDTDGLYLFGEVSPGTEWIPYDEMDLVVLDDLGDAVAAYDFDPGMWELDEGGYELRDLDNNGLLSAGDRLEVGLLPGYDFALLDEWADDYASIEFA